MIDEKTEIKMCSYNIHKGFSTTNRRSILKELRYAIRSTNADLLFLQEVVSERKKACSVSYPQFEYLADKVWPHHAYGRNAIYQRGHHGNAILSKEPFLNWNNLDISLFWFSQRGVLYGQLRNGIVVVCIHLGLLAWERRKQLDKLLTEVIAGFKPDTPLIIAGDFNDWNMSLHKRLVGEYDFKEVYSEKFGSPAKTFPARFPLLAMDRIYFRNLRLKESRVLSGRHWGRLSDHCALFASLELLE